MTKNKYIETVLTALKPYRKRVIFGLTAAMIAAGFDAVAPMLLKLGVDGLREGKPVGWLYLFAGLIVITALIGGLFRFWMRNAVISVSRWAEFDIRQNFFEHLLKLSPSFFDRNHTGDLMARATDDIERLRMVMGPAMLYSTATLLTLIVSASMMVYIDAIMAGLVFLLVPIITASVIAVSSKLHHANLMQQKTYGNLTSYVQENLTGIRVIKAFAREDHESEQFNKVCKRYYKRSLEVARIQALFMPLLGLIVSLGVVGILWIGGARVIAEVITLGDFIAFMGYLTLMTWPMISVGWVVMLYQRGAASHSRIEEIDRVGSQFASMNTDTPTKQSTAEIKENVAPEITFQNVQFRYRDEGPDVLSNINLTIPSGHTVAIVGRTGSGKSSLVRLLARLYEHQQGDILIGGQSNIDSNELRKMIGYVDQTPFIFSSTIMQNIRFGNPDATDEDVLAAAYSACFDQDVSEFADGYETLLGERGVTLSGGQQQRLIIARALLLDRPILVLDDSLSAVDADTEAEIIARMSERLSGRTTLMVTHRLAIAEQVDSVIVIDDGKIVEHGSHDQLVTKDGVYAQMYRQQRLTEEIVEMA